MDALAIVHIREEVMLAVVAKWIKFYGQRGLDTQKVTADSYICHSIVQDILTRIKPDGMEQDTLPTAEVAMKVLATFQEAAIPGYHFFPLPDKQPGLKEAVAVLNKWKGEVGVAILKGILRLSTKKF